MAYIQGLCLQKTNTVFIGDNDPGTVGVIDNIPTPKSGGVIDGDYIATPVGEGVVAGLVYKPYNLAVGPGTLPTPDSFPCFRIYDRWGSDDWYIAGTTANYNLASEDAECCSATPYVLPTEVPLLSGWQLMCQQNSLGQYFAVLGVPSPVTNGYHLYPYGYFNGTALTPASPSSGFTTPAALLTWIQANWTVGGYLTWSMSADDLTLIAIAGAAATGTDVLGATVILVNPSTFSAIVP